MRTCSTHDLNRVVVNIESEDFWGDCNRFLVELGYVEAGNLKHLRDDTSSLIGLYKLHACHYVTHHILCLQAKCQEFRNLYRRVSLVFSLSV